jgi:hypothetical protein
MVQMFRALVFYADAKSPPVYCPAIEHEGRVWLAPHWIDIPEQGVKMPKHIIPIDLFEYQRVASVPPGGDYVVNTGLPRQLLDPEIPKELQNKFQVVDRPNIKIPVASK